MTMGLRALSMAAVLAVAACQSPPPSPPAVVASLSQQQEKVLREYGFEQTDEGWELQMSGRLLFDFNSDKLAANQRESVERMGRSLAGVGIVRLRVEGHTDDVGGDAYNERLSLRRAEVVAQALIDAGLPKGNLTVRGYGSSRPLASSSSDANRRENRRVAVIVPVQ